MTGRAWLRMVGQNIRRTRRQFILSSLGISVGIASLTFFIALSSGVRQVVLGKVFHAERIELEPPRSSFDLPLLGGAPAAGQRCLTSPSSQQNNPSGVPNHTRFWESWVMARGAQSTPLPAFQSRYPPLLLYLKT